MPSGRSRRTGLLRTRSTSGARAHRDESRPLKREPLGSPPANLPAINFQVVEVDRGRSGGAYAIDLEVGEQNRAPAQSERGGYGLVDALLRTIEPNRSIG